MMKAIIKEHLYLEEGRGKKFELYLRGVGRVVMKGKGICLYAYH